MGDVKEQQAAALEAATHRPLARLLSLDDVQAEARRRLPKAIYEYIASGSEDEQTLWENRQGFKRVLLCPRVGRDVSKIDMSLTLFKGTPHAQDASFPIFVSPAGVHCLMHPEGEAATARAAQKEGIIMGISQHATKSMEEIALAAASAPSTSPSSSPSNPASPSLLPLPPPLWYQLYILHDRSLTVTLVRRAEAAGYKALILTVDSPVFGFREADWRNGFVGLPEGMVLANYPTKRGYDDREKGGWDQNSEALLDRSSNFARDLPWLRSVTLLPIIIKGVLSPEDAIAAAEAGCHGLIISNHGGRQLDSCLSSIEALPAIAHALRQRGFLIDADLRAGVSRFQSPDRKVITLLLDSGVRRGTDVLKALALGASAVLLGKPIFFGLAVGGEEGVRHVLNVLRRETETAMVLCGCKNLGEIGREVVRGGGREAYVRPSKL